MKNFLFINLLLFSLQGWSQVVNNLVVFCNDGEPFTLIMNGERYNNEPQTKVRVTGLTLTKYQVRIIFTNSKIKETKTTLTFFNTGKECEFSLNRSGKKYRMDYLTSKDIEGYKQIINNESNSSPSSNPAPGKNSESNSSNTIAPPTNTNAPSSPPPSNTPVSNPPNVTGTAPPVKCNTPLSQPEFQKYKSEILKKVTDEEKKVLANALLEGNCLLTGQVKEILGILVADSSKLDFAKKAYEKTKDVINYSNLTETFISSPVKEEFKKFLSNKK